MRHLPRLLLVFGKNVARLLLVDVRTRPIPNPLLVCCPNLYVVRTLFFEELFGIF